MSTPRGASDVVEIVHTRFLNIRVAQIWRAQVTRQEAESLLNGPGHQLDQWVCDNGVPASEDQYEADDEQLDWDTEIVEVTL